MGSVRAGEVLIGLFLASARRLAGNRTLTGKLT
jgi:hypothetical protein